MTLIIAPRKLRPYFQAKTILVLSNFLFRKVLQKPDALESLLKWVVELNEFDILFKTRASIKGQVLTNFVLELSNVPKMRYGTHQAPYVKPVCGWINW